MYQGLWKSFSAAEATTACSNDEQADNNYVEVVEVEAEAEAGEEADTCTCDIGEEGLWHGGASDDGVGGGASEGVEEEGEEEVGVDDDNADTRNEAWSSRAILLIQSSKLNYSDLIAWTSLFHHLT